MTRHLTILILFLAVLSPVSVVSAADDQATVSKYDVAIKETIVVDGAEEKKVHELSLEVFDLPGSHRNLIFTVVKDEIDGQPVTGSKAAVPIGAVQLHSKGRFVVVLGHPQPVTSTLLTLAGLDETVPDDRLKSLEGGKERIKVSGIGVNRKVPVAYSGKELEDREDRVEYRVQLDGDPITATFGQMKLKLQKLRYRMHFSKDDHRLLVGSWRHELQRTFQGKEKLEKRVLEVTETEHRVLTRKEWTSVQEEFASLLPLGRALLPGRVHGAAARELREILKKYEDEHEEGLLRGALPALETSLAAKLEEINKPLDPEVTAKAMVGKKAPEFKLPKLGGGDIALSDLEGKIVLVAFWSLS